MARKWTMVSPSSGRRAAARVRPGPLPIDLSTIGRGTVMDISESGALVTTAVRQRVGSHFAFTLRWHYVRLELCGFVVRCEVHQEIGARLVWTDATGYDIAVQFADVPASSTKTLSQVMRAMSALITRDVAGVQWQEEADAAARSGWGRVVAPCAIHGDIGGHCDPPPA